MKRNYAIVGRIPDGENSVLLLRADSVEEAVEKFVDALHRDEPEEREHILAMHGTTHYIDAILVSDSPITIVEEPQGA